MQACRQKNLHISVHLSINLSIYPSICLYVCIPAWEQTARNALNCFVFYTSSFVPGHGCKSSDCTFLGGGGGVQKHVTMSKNESSVMTGEHMLLHDIHTSVICLCACIHTYVHTNKHTYNHLFICKNMYRYTSVHINIYRYCYM